MPFSILGEFFNKKALEKNKILETFRLYIKHLFRYPQVNQSVATFRKADGLYFKEEKNIDRFHSCRLLLKFFLDGSLKFQLYLKKTISFIKF